MFISSLASVVVFAHRKLRRTRLKLSRSTCLRVFSFSCFVALHASSTSACDHIPAGKSFWIRLLDPVASYSSKPGATIRAILIQSPECSDGPVFPAGLELEGEVIAVHKVGLGIKHETASLEVQFDRLVTTNGDALPLAAQVVEIDNARETVHHGVIHGINATNSPQGRITSRLIHLPTYNPYSDLGLLTYRTIFSRLPEPEIYLPPGTDLRLQLNLSLDVADQPELPRPSFQMDEYERGDVEMLLSKSSGRTTTRSGKDADLVNILFVGSRDQIQQAFTAAGWLPSDHNSTHAIFKQFEAVLTFSNYPTMPISRQLLNGDPQTLTWQKSFDSYEKREHLRLWIEPSEVQGQEAWLGAYT
ncbi:MAG: LssY C-terminal domain-containing protein, partial [Candidatus Acidiferrum sp.]